MSYLDHIALLHERAERTAAQSSDEPRFVGFVVRDAAGALDNREVDRAYTLFTVSLALMYRWLDTLPYSEDSGVIALLRPGPDRDRLAVERAVSNRYSCYPLAYAGHTIADLRIAESFGLNDASRSERHHEVLRAIRAVPAPERERPLLWILDATRR